VLQLLAVFQLLEITLWFRASRCFIAAKTSAVWVFTAIEVSSRLWPACVVGRRSYRNTARIFNQTVYRAKIGGLTLVTTDGFEFYQRVVRTAFGVAAVHGQVVKTRRNNRVHRVQRSTKLGTAAQLYRLLLQSEDSETLNTSFVERLNLTLRQSLAYLQRRCLAHARCFRRLDQDLALIQCHYNFIRPHGALKFGSSYKTPAIQAGLTARRLLLRDIFTQQGPSRSLALILTFSIRPPAPILARSTALLAA